MYAYIYKQGQVNKTENPYKILFLGSRENITLAKLLIYYC